MLAALFTVNAAAEGADDGGVRGEGQVVVGPLAEDGHQVSVERVAVHPGVGSSEDIVGHLPYLRRSKWTSDWRRPGTRVRVHVFSKCSYPELHYQGQHLIVDS